MSIQTPARPRLRERPSPEPTLDRLLDEEHVADVLAVSPRRVRRLRVEGKLHAVRVGRHVRFRPSDVAAYLDGIAGGVA